MKRRSLFFAVLFFLILFTFAVLTFALPARSFSENENRELAGLPELSWENVKNGTFQAQLGDFLSDQIPGREFWVRANTALKRLMGSREIAGVYFGDEGYYFQKFTEESYSRPWNEAKFRLLESLARETGRTVYVMPVPTPGIILHDQLPAGAPMYDADGIWKLLEESAPSCTMVDLRGAFSAAQGQLYYRTDHHWTAQGAYEAYRVFAQAANLPLRELEEFGLERVSDSFYGTVYSKTLDAGAQPDEIWAPVLPKNISVTFDGKETRDTIYFQEYLDKKDKYAYFFGGNWGRVDIRTGVQNGRTLLVVKDSFANSFIPYLLGDYEQITMVDLRYFRGSVKALAEEQDAQILLLYEMSNLLTDTKFVELTR